MNNPASQAMEEESRKIKRAEGEGGEHESGDNVAGGSDGGAGDGHGDDHMEDEEGDWETETSESEEEELDDNDDDTSGDGTYDEDELADYDINPNDPESIFYHLNHGSMNDVNQFGDSEGEGDEGSEGFEDIEDDDESEGEEESDDEDEEMHGPHVLDDDEKIEELSPRTRAIYRPIYLDDDIMSDFSGDEKYAPKEFISGNDGEGDQDMVDFSVYEENNEEDPEFYKVATKIRELMLNLKKGRAERERKLRTQPGYQQRQQESSTNAEDSPVAPVIGDGLSPSATVAGEDVPHIFGGKYVDPAPFLHRLLVRGLSHPREVEHSPAISNHFQCANSMVITPSTMGLWDDIFTIHLHSIMRCGVLERNTLANYNRRTLAHFAQEHPYVDVAARKAVLRPYARPLRTVKASKFMDLYSYRFDQMPESEDYIRLEDRDDPICLASRYGYMAHGAVSGSIAVYCTQCNEEPYEIDSAYLSSSEDDDGVMLNSLQIVRWNRYYRSRASQDDDLLETMADRDGDDPLIDYDEEDGYPSKKSGQFDHFLVMAGNEGGLVIASLPDHVDPKRAHKDDPHHHRHRYHHSSTPEHRFKYRDDRTWIREGFGGALLNDAKASPNGRWIAAVGDSTQVWIIEVTHVPETEEQRILREAREKEMDIEDLETDSEYATDEDEKMSEDEVVDGSEEKNDLCTEEARATAVLDKPRGEKRSRGSEDSLSDNDGEDGSSQPKSPKPTTIPRLLHLFGQPQELLVPHKVLFTAKHKKNRQPRGPDGAGSGSSTGSASGATKVSFQYVAWNASSTKFAHSSDTTSRVVVWSMPSREIVCCVDTGGPAYAIEFHPKLENLFAVANWYGFVHVVDLTGACVGDEDLVVSDTRYNGQAEQGGPSLAGCEGPHYEEKHDILMVSFRGQSNMKLRIFDGIRGLGWSTDGRHLYVSTLRRVLRYEVVDSRVRVPSLFQLCARKVKEWKEREIHRIYTREKESSVRKAFGPLQDDWKFVPYLIKRKIFGDHFLMRSHNE
ncbi:hypothetical protein BG015_006229 [Linnemannia schmuckeri]|uniref:Uncharacterized protein n=1 Tax=Linnemannia schmuckeri TaxID=64567 RepID=A0A9P5S006_9FUNG|nr:hypothetical protein BG015_006229 [Linnemannia schmuckeri]